MRHLAVAAAAIIVCALPGCGDDAPDQDPDPDAGTVDAQPDVDADPGVTWPFELPPGFPVPRLPDGERLTAELAELGRYLFYDKRLSGNGTQACAGCHDQARAFTDGRDTGLGSEGAILARNSMSLTNVAYNPVQTWANPLLGTLEAQAAVPLFGETPIELGASAHAQEILDRLAADADYPARFAAAFPGETELFTWGHVIAAIGAFERRLISGDSPVDRFRRGDATALTDQERRGYELFFSERLECFHCHGGFNFTIAVDHATQSEPAVHYFNDGLYNIGDGGYPAGNQGLYEFTLDPMDRGRFRPPTLRNIGVTAPYMHDGSVATLEEVVDLYARGGRLITTGPNAGDGALNPNKNALVAGFEIDAGERDDLLAFLRALTDEAFLTDPTLADPFAP
ncbi:MAG: di-heme enzyme [Kofleriaceae bacterium]|nr:di-heme enzyme [Kofleriaceae bacterium]